MTPFTRDTMQPHDRDYIFDSWKKSYREGPRVVGLPNDVYEPFQQKVIERLLPRCTVLVARPEGWEAGILGWVCAEQREDVFAVHYGFVKRRARRRTTGHSIFWALVESLEPRGRGVFTHLRPPFTYTFTTHGYAFAPEYAIARGDAA